MIFFVCGERGFMFEDRVGLRSRAMVRGPLPIAVKRFGLEKETKNKDGASKDSIDPLRPPPTMSSRYV